MLIKRARIISQRRINTTIIYNYYMCDRLTKRKSQVRSCHFQIHPTTWVMNIILCAVFFMLVKRARIVSQRRMYTIIIYNYYMCDCLTTRKSQVKSYGFIILD